MNLELYEDEGMFDESGGELNDEGWAEALVLSAEPPEDPTAYRDECEGMGKE